MKSDEGGAIKEGAKVVFAGIFLNVASSEAF